MCLMLFKKLKAVHLDNMSRNFAKSDCKQPEDRTTTVVHSNQVQTCCFKAISLAVASEARGAKASH